MRQFFMNVLAVLLIAVGLLCVEVILTGKPFRPFSKDQVVESAPEAVSAVLELKVQ